MNFTPSGRMRLRRLRPAAHTGSSSGVISHPEEKGLAKKRSSTAAAVTTILPGLLLPCEPKQQQADRQDFHAELGSEKKAGNDLLEEEHSLSDSIEYWPRNDLIVSSAAGVAKRWEVRAAIRARITGPRLL